MGIETTPRDAADHLDSTEAILGYLEAVFEDGDPELIAAGAPVPGTEENTCRPAERPFLAIRPKKAKDRPMRRALLALAAAFVLMPTGGAVATSIVSPPPHDPKLACREIRRLVANLNAGRLEGRETFAPTFFSEKYGEVESGEEAAFLHGLRHSEGKRDRVPMRLGRVAILHGDKLTPVYLVVLERETWQKIRLEVDGMANIEEIEDPDYRQDTSDWLVSFTSNQIESVREVSDLYKLRGELPELKDCGED